MVFKTPENKKIVDLEKEVLSYWKKNKIFEKSVEQRDDDDLYVFYDGPPFISGLPHYGHLLGSIAKDIIPRYWTMKGKKVERSWGWDAHGITVENAVQKELGIKDRRGIEDYGLDEFIKACDEYTSRVSDEWEWYIDRIGRWVDMKNAYKTTDQTYMESVIWAFKQLYEKGLIYEGLRTSLYCPTCGTPVSDFEIAMDNSYKDVEDPAVTLKFKVKTKGKFKDFYILAWTTTPWTLPSNRALVVDKDSPYVVVEYEKEKYILAKALVNDSFDNPKIVKEVIGSDLLGLEYEPLFDIYEANDKDYKVYHFEDMVHMEDGTGVVHSAPGFGDIDTEMGIHYGLSMTHAIDGEGKFVAGYKENPYEGMYFKKADLPVMENLKERNLLFKHETINHRYPFHDRCDTLLVHRAQKSWFVNVEDLKEDMLKGNEKINWVPSHLKHGQFKTVVENAPDWCISRTRFWATPMPVWESKDGDRIVIGSKKELEDLSGMKVENFHRPYIDKITIEKDGKTYTRRKEVLDSWMEAGSMSFAQFHYPFENKEKFEKNFPGSFITEYIAQVRAWFNVMHRMSTALFGKESFRNVIVTGVMQGNDGRKMSKTFKNYTDPKKIIETVGGDALRLYFLNSPLMIAENTNFNETELKIKSRNVLNPLWNSLKYFLIYAEKSNWKPKSSKIPESENVLDTWIVARLHEMASVFEKNIESYVVPPAIQAIEDFVDDLSRWYIRRSRSRISKGDENALATLYYVLLNFSKVAAPAIPFLTESMFTRLTDKESVHLEDYPDLDNKIVSKNQKLIESMAVTREIASAILAARVLESIAVRQPLGEILVKKELEIPKEFEEILLSEVNVKEIKYVNEIKKSENLVLDPNENVALNTEITEELKIEGLSREIIRSIQSLRKKESLDVSDEVEVTYPSDKDVKEAVKKYKDIIMETVGATDLVAGEDYAITKKN